jgi:hypothetical protein
MGCDIHMVVQVRRNGVWTALKDLDVPCNACGGTKRVANGEKLRACEVCEVWDGKNWVSTGKTPIYENRNYSVFAVLAGVRNRDKITPISKPKGLPPDFEVVDEHYTMFDKDMGDHSYSWLTLAELQAYPWQCSVVHGGWVTEATYEEWKKAGRGWPRAWSGEPSGGNTELVSNERMDEIIQCINIDPDKHYFTRIEWGVSVAESASTFYTSFMTALTTLGAPEDVRIVFGFDN